MGIKESIVEWKRSKRARGREVALLPEYDRHYYINSYHDKKQNVKRNIHAMSCDMTMRDSVFARFNEIRFDRMMNERRQNPDYVEFKRITRNRLVSVRIMRFNNGLPLVFGGPNRKFWADPLSRYVPEDYHKAIKAAGIEFPYRIGFMMRSGRAQRIARDIWGGRGHHGYWTMREIEEGKGTGEHPTVHIFSFQNFTDFLDFRFHYEDDYEKVET